MNNQIDTIAEEDRSDGDDGTERATDTPQEVHHRKQKRKNNLEMATVEDKSFQSNPSGTEDIMEGEQVEEPGGQGVGEDEKSESELLDEQTVERDFRKKRLCFKIDKHFTTLFEDLNLLCEWENDEKKRGSNDKS